MCQICQRRVGPRCRHRKAELILKQSKKLGGELRRARSLRQTAVGQGRWETGGKDRIPPEARQEAGANAESLYGWAGDWLVVKEKTPWESSDR